MLGCGLEQDVDMSADHSHSSSHSYVPEQSQKPAVRGRLSIADLVSCSQQDAPIKVDAAALSDAGERVEGGEAAAALMELHHSSPEISPVSFLVAFPSPDCAT